MKVLTRAKGPGTHRVQYECRWYSWALPLHVGIGTSFFPTETSGFDLERWTKQTVLIVDVLCFRMVLVLAGPLFDEDAEE